MDKCICFNRVSTVSQDIEQQKDIVYNECIKDGFLPENIIIISHKESAIKLSIQEREGIQELMNYINTDPNITSVYVYEISRISRQAKMLYEIRDFLIEKHIQLIVLKPYLKLLDIDGNISQAASILFSIFTSLSESEMMIKKERLQRGKLAKKKQGCFTGGKILYGYTTDKEKHIIIDKEKSEIVKRIYNMYLSGYYSTSKISDILYNEGLYTLPNKKSRDSFICKVLKTIDYCKSDIYEAIITEDDFNKVKELREKYHCKPKVKYENHVYLGQKLLYHYETGLALKVRKRDCSYFLDEYKIYINLNMVDSLLLYAADYSFKFHGYNDLEELQAKTIEELTRVDKRLKSYDKEKSKILSSFERLEERYIIGSISKIKLDELEKKLKSDLDKIEISKNDDLNKQNTLNKTLNIIKDKVSSFKYIDIYSLPEKEQQEYIRKEIKKVIVRKVENYYEFVISYINPLLDGQIYKIYSKRHKIYLYNEEINCVILKRFKRYKQRPHTGPVSRLNLFIGKILK